MKVEINKDKLQNANVIFCCYMPLPARIWIGKQKKVRNIDTERKSKICLSLSTSVCLTSQQTTLIHKLKSITADNSVGCS